MTHKYSSVFYDYIETGSLASAEIIVPIVYDTIQFQTLIDVGCGRGAWLSVFKQKGNANVFGMDGDYVKQEHLMIHQDNFIPTDLNQPFPLIEKKYDLLMSLEVAEHLRPERSKSFVDDLCTLSDIIVFSAATIGQGGENHINERPLEDWRQFFQANNYQAFDYVRPLIKESRMVEPWYKYNILIYANTKGQERLHQNILATRITDNQKIIEGGHFTWKLRKNLVKLLPNSCKTLIAQIISYLKRK